MKKLRRIIKLFVYFGMLALIAAFGLFLYWFQSPATGETTFSLDQLQPWMVISIVVTTLVFIYLLIIRRLKPDKFGRTLLWIVNSLIVFLVAGYTFTMFTLNYSLVHNGLYILFIYIAGLALLAAGIVFAFFLMLKKEKPADEDKKAVTT